MPKIYYSEFHSNYVSGSFSQVKKATHKKTGEVVAVKIIKKKDVGDKAEMIETEIDILRRVRHPNIISLKEMFETDKEICLVMELYVMYSIA